MRRRQNLKRIGPAYSEMGRPQSWNKDAIAKHFRAKREQALKEDLKEELKEAKHKSKNQRKSKNPKTLLDKENVQLEGIVRASTPSSSSTMHGQGIEKDTPH
ncbi:hypothetical protein ABW20_dc0101692 [Dactylellina cionopaga]|nr:hypothetical protein ABW20_dc0101692 [Dactylellina cionopaga]